MGSAPGSREPELIELMAGYQRGDRDAATELIRAVSPALRRFFAVQTQDGRYADDLLQETWLRIHKARHTYRPGDPVLPWIYAIARYTRVDTYRRRRRLATREQSMDGRPDPPAPEPQNSGHLPDLDTMLAALPESQREVVALLKVAGLSLDEVARATSSSVGSVKQKAHRAYEKLREALAEFGPRSHGKEAS